MQHIAVERTQSPPQNANNVLRSNVVLTALVVLTLMSGWSIFLYLGIGSLVPPKPLPIPPPDKIEPEPVVKMTVPDASNSPISYDDTEQVFVRSLQNSELRARAARTRTSLQHAETLAAQFKLRKTELQTNQSGRRLANPVTARKMKFLFSYPRDANFADVQRMLSDADRSINAPPTSVATFRQLVASLVDSQSMLDQISRQYEAADRAIDELLEQNAVAHPSTLQESIEQLPQSDALTVKQQADAEVKNERSSQVAQLKAETDRLATLESELEKAKGNQDLIRDQSHARLESSQQSVLKAERDLSTRKTVAMAQMQAAFPSVRSLLTPFTTPGYRQPAASSQLEITSEKQPMSYSGLSRTGALEDSNRGLEILFYMAQPHNAFGKLNDRPLGEFPVYESEFDIKNAEVRAKVKRLQAFLRDYGAAMVEAGLLSK